MSSGIEHTEVGRDQRQPPLRVLAWPARKNSDEQPYNALLYDAMEALPEEAAQVREFAPWRLLLGRYDVWHLHWPEGTVRSDSTLRAGVAFAAVVLLLIAARLRGVRLVWTAHNIFGHDPTHPGLDRMLRGVLVRACHGVVSLTEGGLNALRRTFPALGDKPMTVIPHGHYRAWYGAPPDRGRARDLLGLADTDTVLLCLGQIKRYKNVPALIRAFVETRGRNLCLVVAGQPDSAELRREIEAAARDDSRVMLHLGFIDAGALPRYFGAADLFVVPFRQIQNSGSVLLALSMGVPVWVPDIGGMRELQGHFGRDWVGCYRGEWGETALNEGVMFVREERGSLEGRLRALDWDVIAAAHVDFFRRLVDGTDDQY